MQFRVPNADLIAQTPPPVKPTLTLAETTGPDGADFCLMEHDGHFSLHTGGMQLESSFAHGAAEQLGALACRPFRPVRKPRLLFAGLGLGYTLAAALTALPQKRALFLVAEPVRELPGWHRRFLSPLHAGLLDDSRVEIRAQSAAEAMKEDGEGFHAVLLDARSRPPEAGVTDRKGVPVSGLLHRAHSALKDGGLLAVLCAVDSPVLERRFRQAGFEIAREAVPVAHKGKQTRRATIWLARKGDRLQKEPQPRDRPNLHP